MKFFTRLGIYKASNVTFNPDTCQAYSYAWWRFVDVVNGKVIFNNYNYSSSTCKHQSKVRRILSERGIEIDFMVYSQAGLHSSGWKTHSINHLSDAIKELETKLANPRRKKALDEERVTQLNNLTQERERLVSFINTIQE